MSTPATDLSEWINVGAGAEVGCVQDVCIAPPWWAFTGGYDAGGQCGCVPVRLRTQKPKGDYRKCHGLYGSSHLYQVLALVVVARVDGFPLSIERAQAPVGWTHRKHGFIQCDLPAPDRGLIA